MKVFVTGANGFVGAALCRKLIDQGFDVLGLVRKTSDLSLLEGNPVTKVVGSLEDIESIAGSLPGVKTVYHAAAAVSDWGSLEYFRKVNVEATRQLIEASISHGVNRFVYVSSTAVHSFIGARDMDENSPQHPTPFPYCQSKREAEAMLLEMHDTGDIEVVIVRPGDVYGPGDRTSLLKMAPHLEKGLLGYVGGGKKLGAFTYVENLADGLLLAGSKREAAGEAIIITDGSAHTWRDYFETLCKELGIGPPRYSLPIWFVTALANLLESIYRPLRISSRPPVTRYLAAHLGKDYHFTIAKAARLLGYMPKVSFEEAVAETARWYLDYRSRSWNDNGQGNE